MGWTTRSPSSLSLRLLAWWNFDLISDKRHIVRTIQRDPRSQYSQGVWARAPQIYVGIFAEIQENLRVIVWGGSNSSNTDM